MAEFQPLAFGKYTLVERIGVGPMAEFFRATIPDGQGDWNTIFIKRLLPQFASNQLLLDAFSNAARISRHFEHENISKVLDFGQVDGAFYLAAEFLSGYSLHDIMAASRDRGVSLGLENALFITAQICRGLAYAHGFVDPDGIVPHVIHANLSPQAIFVTKDGRIKLTDFAIQAEKGQDRTAHLDMMKWRLAYMSPEQVGGDPVDNRSDIFSLGVLFYEMIVGRQAFQGQTMEVFSLVRQARYEPLENWTTELPSAVYQIIDRCLDKDPAKRYPSAGAMLEDVQGVMNALTEKPSAETFIQNLGNLFNTKTPAVHGPEEKKFRSGKSARTSKKAVPAGCQNETVHNSLQDTQACSGKKPGPRSMIVPSGRFKKIYWFVGAPVLMFLSLFVSLIIINETPIQQTLNASEIPAVQNANKALEEKNYHRAVLGFEQALASEPAIREVIAQAYARALDGRASDLLKKAPDQAVELLMTARQFDPHNIQVCARLGLLYLNMKQYEKAIAIYEEAVKLDPQLADAFFNLGYIYAVTKDFPRAQEMYNQAVRLSPPFLDEALFNLAVVQIQVGKRQESINNLKRAIEVNPNNAQAQQYLKRLTS